MRFLGLILILLLTSCQQYHTNQADTPAKSTQQPSKKNAAYSRVHPPSKNTSHDSAPKGPPPKTFKKIIPKQEPLSHYGNPDTYRVEGKRYDVMTTTAGYHARGLASWYGTKFHARRTSSGEHYDMYALTAAHKTLPLPTYLRVKNLSNGKSVIVKVNDRGPFHSDRILDLSYGAAVKLGIFPKGTSMVEIEALNLHPKGKTRVAQYYLQAGAFSSSALANTLRNKLSKVTKTTVFIEPYQNRYIVKVGPFENKHMTDQVKNTLQKNGVQGAFSILQ
jgi:rare lipoprotein A